MKNRKLHRQIVRENNKKRYHEDAQYRKTQLEKGKIRNLARTMLVEKHEEEYEELLLKAENKIKKKG